MRSNRADLFPPLLFRCLSSDHTRWTLSRFDEKAVKKTKLKEHALLRAALDDARKWRDQPPHITPVLRHTLTKELRPGDIIEGCYQEGDWRPAMVREVTCGEVYVEYFMECKGKQHRRPDGTCIPELPREWLKQEQLRPATQSVQAAVQSQAHLEGTKENPIDLENLSFIKSRQRKRTSMKLRSLRERQ